MKILFVIILSFILLGCAKGRVDILSQEGHLLGHCTANFYWHWHGAKDSVDYMLYRCAKEHRDQGRVISDISVFDNDYTLPLPPEGESWNKRNSYNQYKSGALTERKYGYILAAIEYDYIQKKSAAKSQYESGAIDQNQYEKFLKSAEETFSGK